MANLLQWLRIRQREAERSRDAAARNKQYGEAQLREGIASAYAYTIEHLKEENAKSALGAVDG